jgi:hypothetical protein
MEILETGICSGYDRAGFPSRKTTKTDYLDNLHVPQAVSSLDGYLNLWNEGICQVSSREQVSLWIETMRIKVEHSWVWRGWLV